MVDRAPHLNRLLQKMYLGGTRKVDHHHLLSAELPCLKKVLEEAPLLYGYMFHRQIAGPLHAKAHAKLKEYLIFGDPLVSGVSTA